MTQEEKTGFLKTNSFELIAQLEEHKQPTWGKMNAQQMVEHLNDFYNVSIEKIIFALTVPVEHLPKYREFLFSDKPFRENTKAPETVLGEEPLPIRTQSLAAAKTQLQQTVNDFFQFFAPEPTKTTTHPVFGPLNFEEWVLLHYKHVTHHLKQFELMS